MPEDSTMHIDSSALISQLSERASREGKLGRVVKHDHSVWDYPGLTISSWKFNEWDFYNPKAELPTNARGLFTLGEDRILLRGYNKFFNINEVRATDLTFLKTNTQGPYAATVKENGCIVLISGLNGKLVVTSKHASGPSLTGQLRNHSRVGRDWVLRHLEKAGRTEEQLAHSLEQRGWTAVGELCDDTFEEHVLAYPKDQAGIYLNGLNHNTAEFVTEPFAVVNEFSEEWGFLRTEFAEFESFDTLYKFLQSCAETGRWLDREIEGFVIRCKLEGGDFFFKYKFEEPYYMYRQWREVTRKLLIRGPQPAAAMARRGRHSKSSLEFLAFASDYISKHPDMREKLLVENLGIIELRKHFLDGNGISEQQLLEMSSTGEKRWIIVPVSTVGCGKTTVGRALIELFGDEWSHVQNDNIKKKKRRADAFKESISSEMYSHRVVIADRGNGDRAAREQLMSDIDADAAISNFDTKFVCLNFLPQGPSVASRKLTRELVRQRGTRHQTLKLDNNEQAVNGIMKRFELRFEPVNTALPPDNQFDLVLDLEPGNTRANVAHIVSALRTRYEDLNVPNFTESDMNAAVSKALEYDPAVEDIDESTIQATKNVRFFAVSIGPEHRNALIEAARALVPANIMANIAIQKEFHVTLAHREDQESQRLYKDLIHKYKAIIPPKMRNETPLGSEDTVSVTHISWSKKVVAFKVRIDGECSNSQAHITVGTADGVPAYVANALFSGIPTRIEALEAPLVLKNQKVTAYK